MCLSAITSECCQFCINNFTPLQVQTIFICEVVQFRQNTNGKALPIKLGHFQKKYYHHPKKSIYYTLKNKYVIL